MNDSVVIIDSTSQDYILYSYEISDHYHNLYYSDIAYVPWYHASNYSPVGIDKIILKYDHIIQGTFIGTAIWPVLSEEIGFEWDRSPLNQYPEYNEKVTVKTKFYNGSDSVLVITGYFYVTNTAVTFPEKRVLEFVKNVGLVSDIKIDTVSVDTIHKKMLIDYHISKK